MATREDGDGDRDSDRVNAGIQPKDETREGDRTKAGEEEEGLGRVGGSRSGGRMEVGIERERERSGGEGKESLACRQTLDFTLTITRLYSLFSLFYSSITALSII